MEMTPELAEICGIHAGDGYLRFGKRTEWDISGHVEEREYYDSHVIPLIKRVFKIPLIGQFFKSRNTYGLVIRNKEVVKSLLSLGFPNGEKSTTVKIPKEILNSNDKAIYVAFLRGLFDTDGNVNFRKSYGKYIEFKKTKNHYPSINFTTVSSSLAKDLIEIFTSLDFKLCSLTYSPKNPKENKKYIVNISGRYQLEKWINTIGIKNSVKLSRYLIWKKFGFCPTNTSFNERLSILNGKLDPNMFYKGP
jgi:intein/homing endonuclease